ncbi:P-loop containing nucleoside triphosphate hydrolase protein, partial [Wallemia mellicola]
EQRLELVINACKVANADGFINTLPEKYDNSVGERGMLLSGGQKQRVAIARAIVSDPPILLLDEATAALDSASESIVQKALDKAAKNRTTIAIAHRLSTIKNANQIIVMGGGEILEVGDHNSLTANPDGAYSTFVAAQSLAQAKDEEAAQVNSDVVEKNDDLHEEVIPLNRVKSGRSVTSQILEKNNEEKVEKEHHYSMFEVIRRLVKMNRPGWSAYTSGSIAALVTGSAYPIMGILLGRILQHIAARSPTDPDYHSYIRHQIDRDSLWFFIMAIGAALGILIQSWAMHYAGELLTYALRHESFKKLLRSDVEYFDKKENSTGVLTSNLADNAQKVQGLAGISASTIIQSCSTLIVGVAIGIGYNWKLGLVGTACIPLTLSAGITRLKIVVTKDQQNKKSYEDSAEMACEAAGAIRTVASLTREGQALEEYKTLLRTPLRNSIRTSLWSSAIYGLSQGMAFLVIALIFWYGSQLIMNLEIELEDFYVCLMAVVFSSIQAGNVFTFVPDVSNARGGAARILKLLDTKTEIEIETTSQDGKHLDTVEGHITFEDVHFRYPTRSDVPVLRSLDLEIKPGSYVALVGPSGCGKSTTIQLIERFYDPAYGSVKLDGHEVRDLNLNNLRSHMALVSQEPTLYAGTVKYNILMGAVKPHEEVSQQELEDACADANILDFIKGLPDGFETQVGGKGTQLSGGQKQRIAIARALIRKPKILLLDEATSALDQTSEAVVQAALDKVASGRTTIAIAHRLSTIQKADRIYVIKDGKVSQAGAHKDLIEQKDGLYAELVALQNLSSQDA